MNMITFIERQARRTCLHHKSKSIKFLIFFTDRSAGRMHRCRPKIVHSSRSMVMRKTESCLGMAVE